MGAFSSIFKRVGCLSFILFFFHSTAHSYQWCGKTLEAISSKSTRQSASTAKTLIPNKTGLAAEEEEPPVYKKNRLANTKPVAVTMPNHGEASSHLERAVRIQAAIEQLQKGDVDDGGYADYISLDTFLPQGRIKNEDLLMVSMVVKLLISIEQVPVHLKTRRAYQDDAAIAQRYSNLAEIPRLRTAKYVPQGIQDYLKDQSPRALDYNEDTAALMHNFIEIVEKVYRR